MNPFARRPAASHALLRKIDYLVFDGNFTDAPTNWLLPLPGTTAMESETWDQLMEMTVEDTNLSWVLFPPGPFRM